MWQRTVITKAVLCSRAGFLMHWKRRREQQCGTIHKQKTIVQCVEVVNTSEWICQSLTSVLELLLETFNGINIVSLAVQTSAWPVDMRAAIKSDGRASGVANNSGLASFHSANPHFDTLHLRQQTCYTCQSQLSITWNRASHTVQHQLSITRNQLSMFMHLWASYNIVGFAL